jgi:histidine ammonia-lyase
VLVLDGESMTIDTVYQIAFRGVKLDVSQQALERMSVFREKLEKKIAGNEPIYGVNTGFGVLSNRKINDHDLKKLQVNLIRSHSTGVDPPFSRQIVRCAMAIKLNSLLRGNSCVRPSVALMLKDMLNKDVVPVVPSVGSLGASGDLSPSAYIALVMIGEGKSYYKGELTESRLALRKAGLSPITLEPKEGISLINGTSFTTAIGCVVILLGKKLLDFANSCVSLTGEVLRISLQSFDEDLMQLRGQLGQILMARDIMAKLKGSKNTRSSAVPQDPYSIRCSPQVHGSVYDAISFAQAVVETELNAVTDNPVMKEDGMILHGGNFHAQPIAMVLDLLSLALSYLGDLSLARIHQLMRASEQNRMFYARKPGLESGLMLTEYAATAIMNKNSNLVHPSSSYPANVSGGVEDHASHGVNAGLKALCVADNVAKVLAIELICNSNALEPDQADRLSPHCAKLLSKVQAISQPLAEDRPLGDDIERLSSYILGFRV